MSTTNRRHISERQMQRKSLLLDKSQCLCVVSYNSRYFQAVPILKLFIWQRPGLKICFMPDNTTNQINGIIDWRATKAGRLGSIPVRVTPKTWKMVLPSLALGVNVAHEQFCHWLAISPAFTAKVAAWKTVQASGDGRRKHLATSINETELKMHHIFGTAVAFYSKQNESLATLQAN